jgi:AbiV family abortive infection protein
MGRSASMDGAIVQNARRLQRDAQLLFDHGRYPTSAALAVLSIEEYGKRVSGMSVQHISKQIAAACYGWSGDSLDYLAKLGFKFKRVEDLTEKERALVDDEKYKSFLLNVWPAPSARVFAFLPSSVCFNVSGFGAKLRAKMEIRAAWSS